MEAFFDFEKPIANLEKKLVDLRELAKQEGVDFSQEITLLEKKVRQLIDETYSRLTPWQKVQLSRHPNRPYSRDYVDAIFPDFMELHGDRFFSDDQALLGGVATWAVEGIKGKESRLPVVILGHQKGRTTKQKMERNFGMARPDGYRKAMRLMDLAERSRMPVITFIDTPGAYPGMDAEERGQSQAIAESIQKMFGLTVPVICIVIGEGGSGGALAIGVGDRVLMLEYGVYSVISPESCASILWSDSSLAERASVKLKMNPPELLKMGVIDGIIPEPKGGAHRDWQSAFESMRTALHGHLDPLIQEWLAVGALNSAKAAPVGEAPKAAAKGTAKGTNGKKTVKKPAAATAAAKWDPMPKLVASRLQKFRKIGAFALGHAPAANLTEEPHNA